MDLNTVTGYRRARTREDLRLAPGETIVAGGTWFFSEPQIDSTGIVDISGIDWPAFEDLPGGGLRVAATATIASLAALPPRPHWPAQRLFAQCADALLASFKIQHVATVGGNVCRSFAAASMVSLMAGLDAVAHIWCPDGTDRREPVETFVTGQGTNTLAPGEVLRAMDIPAHALRARSGFRKIALAELGRSGAVVTGRVGTGASAATGDVTGASAATGDVTGASAATGNVAAGQCVIGITAATLRPTILRYPTVPDAETLRRDIESVGGYYTDPLGSADWRRGVCVVLAEQIRSELADEQH